MTKGKEKTRIILDRYGDKENAKRKRPIKTYIRNYRMAFLAVGSEYRKKQFQSVGIIQDAQYRTFIKQWHINCK